MRGTQYKNQHAKKHTYIFILYNGGREETRQREYYGRRVVVNQTRSDVLRALARVTEATIIPRISVGSFSISACHTGTVVGAPPWRRYVCQTEIPVPYVAETGITPHTLLPYRPSDIVFRVGFLFEKERVQYYFQYNRLSNCFFPRARYCLG